MVTLVGQRSRAVVAGTDQSTANSTDRKEAGNREDCPPLSCSCHTILYGPVDTRFPMGLHPRPADIDGAYGTSVQLMVWGFSSFRWCVVASAGRVF